MFRSFESGKEKKRNPFDKDNFLKDDIWERRDVLGKILEARETTDPHKNFFPINTICRNIYIVLDYDGSQLMDINRETVEFSNMEKSDWKGIYATDIRDANNQLILYLDGKKADNILLETHGGPESYVTNGVITGNGTYVSIDNNNHNRIGEKDLSKSIAGTNTKNQIDVDAFISIIKQIKSQGNFYMQSCNTADSDTFFNNLGYLTGYNANLFGSTGFCGPAHPVDPKNPTNAIYSPVYLFNRNTNKSGMIKLYQAGCGGDQPIVLSGIKINRSGIVPLY